MSAEYINIRPNILNDSNIVAQVLIKIIKDTVWEKNLEENMTWRKTALYQSQKIENVGKRKVEPFSAWSQSTFKRVRTVSLAML